MLDKRSYNRWSIAEICFLRKYYFSNGIVFCATSLDRDIVSVKNKARHLGLKTRTNKRRVIVRQLDVNKVIAICSRHGEVLHYYGYSGQSLQCSICTKNSVKKCRQSQKGKQTIKRYQARRNSNRLINYANRLRSRLNYCKSLFGMKKPNGCFRYLPFSSQELYGHLENIRLLQDNHCPICNADYDKVGYHIDHIMPLASADSEDDIWFLFNLSNLSLLCPLCNGRKGNSVCERSF